MKCNISNCNPSDNIGDSYETILNYTYIVDEEFVKKCGKKMDNTLKVRSNAKVKQYYVMQLELGDLLFCAPITMDDLHEFGKSLEEFERDYIPKYYCNTNCNLYFEI